MFENEIEEARLDLVNARKRHENRVGLGNSIDGGWDCGGHIEWDADPLEQWKMYMECCEKEYTEEDDSPYTVQDFEDYIAIVYYEKKYELLCELEFKLDEEN